MTYDRSLTKAALLLLEACLLIGANGRMKASILIVPTHLSNREPMAGLCCAAIQHCKGL